MNHHAEREGCDARFWGETKEKSAFEDRHKFSASKSRTSWFDESAADS
jgi:hypothetical protein